MNGDWRELLGRAMSGETLTPAEAAALNAALDDPENRREAVAWLRFDAAVFQQLHPTENDVPLRSRERLLAKAILREKHREVTRTAPVQRRRSVQLAPLVAVAALLLVGTLFWLWPPDGQGELQAFGSFRVLGAELDGTAAPPLERGDRLVAGNDGARLVLGGYCELELDSRCDVTIRGTAGSERIALHRGQLRARIDPGRGGFRLVTPLGPVEVKGTEFVTTVDFPDSSQGDDVMNAQARRVLVTVAVVTGTVMCQLGDGPMVLKQGANEVFAGEKQDARGVVTATTDLSLTLKTGSGEKLIFQVPEAKKLVGHEVSQLNPGEEIGVVWIEDGGKKWIEDIVGKGAVEGRVTRLGDRWIEVAAEGKKAVRFNPPWKGGNPSEGGGLDKEVLRKLGVVRVGDRVQLMWEMPEGKRVVDIKVLQRGRTEEPARVEADGPIPAGLRGFKGILFGKISEKNDERGTFALEVQKVGRVWQQSRAENAQAAVGNSLPVELTRESRLFDQHRETLQKLNNGDAVEVEVFHVKDGVLSVMELLRKVE